jgi:acetyl-CoA synthetase
MVERHKITSSTPRPPRSGRSPPRATSFVRSTTARALRVLGTVGEPINPEAWEWYYDVVGDNRCNIVDTWWQTETGGHRHQPHRARDAHQARLRDAPHAGHPPVPAHAGGHGHPRARARACCASTIRGRGRPARSGATTSATSRPTSATCPGAYFTGDGCRRDADGYYWITGRVDDVLNVSATAWARPSSRPRSSASRRSPRRRWSASPTRSRGRASTPTSSPSPARRSTRSP